MAGLRGIRRGLSVATLVLFGLQATLPSVTAQESVPGPPVEAVDGGAVALPPAEGELLPDDAGGSGINFFMLMVQGGYFMIPIAVMSLIAVTAAIERAIGLRRARVLPKGLVAALGQLGVSAGGFDPKKAYRICQQFPSAAATVIRAMLLKVGRPQSEVEHAVSEASQREAERLFANVRWINLAAAVTPLLGLLGTVWGMIVAFHDTTTLAPGQNKAEFLATGIYIALVTTLGGLMVAIPAAVVSHLFEGRIQSLFHQIDEMVFNLLPQVERFEGRLRFNRQAEPGNGGTTLENSTIEPPPVSERTGSAN